MERSKSRRSMFRFFGVAFWSWSSVALGCLGFLAPVAHAEDVTVEFEGTILGVCPDGFPFPFFSCFGYDVDPEVSVGTSFSGTYTLPATQVPGGNPNSVVYPVPSTGSVQIGSSTLFASEDFYLGYQLVLVNNDVFGGFWERLDSWTLLPLQSDAITGGPHFCQIFFGESGTAALPPERLSGTGYFVNDSLDWDIYLPGPAQSVHGSFQCFANTSFLDPFVSGIPLQPLFVGEITDIRRVPPPPVEVAVDLKPGSDPNCVKPSSRGSVSVAILGASDLDVSQIDQSSLDFGGAVPQRCDLGDQAPADGIPDLTCHFQNLAVAWPAPGSDCGDVVLTGALTDGTEIEGADLACLAGEPTCKAGKAQ